MEGLMFTVAVVAAACVLIGLARLGAWALDRREEDKTRVIRDAAFVAQAQAEVDDYRWLDSQRFAYARDADGYLDLSLLAPCDEAAFYGHGDDEGEVARG
jgi:hypothetical protein